MLTFNLRIVTINLFFGHDDDKTGNVEIREIGINNFFTLINFTYKL